MSHKTIQIATTTVLRIANIKSRRDLDVWCGGPLRTRLYEEVERLAKEHWDRLRDPRAGVRAKYETTLGGFKLSP